MGFIHLICIATWWETKSTYLFPLLHCIQLKASSSPLCGIRLQMPPLPRPMKNPIGAGDAVSSGTLLRWSGASVSEGTPAKVFIYFIPHYFNALSFYLHYIHLIITFSEHIYLHIFNIPLHIFHFSSYHVVAHRPSIPIHQRLHLFFLAFFSYHFILLFHPFFYTHDFFFPCHSFNMILLLFSEHSQCPTDFPPRVRCCVWGHCRSFFLGSGVWCSKLYEWCQ